MTEHKCSNDRLAACRVLVAEHEEVALAPPFKIPESTFIMVEAVSYFILGLIVRRLFDGLLESAGIPLAWSTLARIVVFLVFLGAAIAVHGPLVRFLKAIGIIKT